MSDHCHCLLWSAASSSRYWWRTRHEMQNFRVFLPKNHLFRFFFQGRTDHGQVDQKGILGEVSLGEMKISPASWEASPVPLALPQNASKRGTLIVSN